MARKPRIVSKIKMLKKTDELFLVCKGGHVVSISDDPFQAAEIAKSEKADTIMHCQIKTIYDRALDPETEIDMN